MRALSSAGDGMEVSAGVCLKDRATTTDSSAASDSSFYSSVPSQNRKGVKSAIPSLSGGRERTY